jgi:hypothetical protein
MRPHIHMTNHPPPSHRESKFSGDYGQNPRWEAVAGRSMLGPALPTQRDDKTIADSLFIRFAAGDGSLSL